MDKRKKSLILCVSPDYPHAEAWMRQMERGLVGPKFVDKTRFKITHGDNVHFFRVICSMTDARRVTSGHEFSKIMFAKSWDRGQDIKNTIMSRKRP